jgi:uncharacterized protein YdhG (YjbR/CyaY superfamily)
VFDEAFGSFEPEQREALQRVVVRVRQLVPEATEGRGYGLPAFRYRDKPLLGFAATARHLSLYPFSAAVLDGVRDQLPDHEVSKGTVRFTAHHPIPDDVLTAIVQARAAEIAGD